MNSSTKTWQTLSHNYYPLARLPLNGFDVQVILLAWLIVGSHDTSLGSCCNHSTEHPTKGKEPSFVCGGDHLADVHHQRSLQQGERGGGELGNPICREIVIIDCQSLTAGSQFLMPRAQGSSWGPSYNISMRYLWAVMGEGRWIVIIWRRASPAGSHFCMTTFSNFLPSSSCTK